MQAARRATISAAYRRWSEPCPLAGLFSWRARMSWTPPDNVRTSCPRFHSGAGTGVGPLTWRRASHTDRFGGRCSLPAAQSTGTIEQDELRAKSGPSFRDHWDVNRNTLQPAMRKMVFLVAGEGRKPEDSCRSRRNRLLKRRRQFEDTTSGNAHTEPSVPRLLLPLGQVAAVSGIVARCYVTRTIGFRAPKETR